MNQEDRERQEMRNALIETAGVILLTKVDRGQLESLNDQQLVEEIQRGFQWELRSYYQESGLAGNVQQIRADTSGEPLDGRLLDLVAHEAGMRPHGESHWSHRAFPKLMKQDPQSGYECTVASAMLKMAFEDAGLEHTRSVHVRGHQAVVRRLPDASLKIYDPATRHTDERGNAHGFMTVIQPEEVVDHQRVDEGHGRTGMAFTVRTKREHPHSGMFAEQDAHGYVTKRFYAYDPSVYVDASVFLSNLSELKEDAQKPGHTAAQELVRQYPVLEKLDWNRIKERFRVFDSDEHLK